MRTYSVRFQFGDEDELTTDAAAAGFLVRGGGLWCAEQVGCGWQLFAGGVGQQGAAGSGPRGPGSWLPAGPRAWRSTLAKAPARSACR